MLNLLIRRPWTPVASRQVAGWWNPREVLTLSLSGGAVETYRNVIGSALLIQTTGSRRPVWNGDAFGSGRPGLVFDGMDDRLERPAVPPFASGADPGEIWAVVRQDALVADTGTRIAVSAGSSASNQRAAARIVASGANRAQAIGRDGTSQQFAQDTTVAFGARHVLRCVFDTTSVSLEIDGVVTTTVTSALGTGTGRSALGCNAGTTPANFWNGAIGDVVPVNGRLPPDEAKRMRDYLNWTIGA